MLTNTHMLRIDWRKHKRIDKTVPIKIRLGKGHFITSTADISCRGASLNLSALLPAGTRIECTIALPKKNKKNVFLAENIVCKGTVVRSKDNKTGGYATALFFDKISQGNIRKISEFVNDNSPETGNNTPHLTL